VKCPVEKCRRKGERSGFCAHHWRMTPERMRRDLERNVSQAKQIARVFLNAAEREAAREERIGA